MKHRTRLHIPKTTKFSYALWYWTRGKENLFFLNQDDLATFTQLCHEASQ